LKERVRLKRGYIYALITHNVGCLVTTLPIVIKVSAVDFSYPQQPAVLKGVDLEIARGSLFGLLGPNGAGKTTLISLLCGLQHPARGSIQFDGEDFSRRRQALLRRLALVPQEYAFYPRLSVMENLAFFSAMAGASTTSRREHIWK
jgi:ABC-2 type transport system ATP-binding protein